MVGLSEAQTKPHPVWLVLLSFAPTSLSFRFALGYCWVFHTQSLFPTYMTHTQEASFYLLPDFWKFAFDKLCDLRN